MAVNEVLLIGRLTASPELKETSSGIPTTAFTIAVNRDYGDNEQADFIQIVAWRQRAEFICKYFKKGNQIFICGTLQSRSYEDRDGNKRNVVEVVANKVEFCGSKPNSLTRTESASQEEEQPRMERPVFEPIDDNTLPF
jgi:single-strand DNA-binding protein